MIAKKKTKKETFMQGIMAIMLSQVMIKLLGLVYKLYLTNREGFGDAGNAIYSSGFQIYALLLTLSSIGVPNAVSKLISERIAIGDNRGAHRVFKISFVVFALIGLGGTCILFFGANYIANIMLQIPEAELTIVALSPSIFFVAIASVIRGYFNGREQMSASANSQTLEQVFKTLLTIIVVEIVATFSNSNTLLMAAGANLATTLATFLGFAYLYLYYKSKRKEVWQDVTSTVNYKPQRIKTIVKQILMVAVPISLSSLLSAVNKNIDAFTVVRGLKTFLTEVEAKTQYGILSGKVDTLTSLPLSFNIAFAVALVPAIASAVAKGDTKTVQKRISYSLLLTMLIGLPCTIGMFTFAEPILNLLFPNAKAGAVVLQISSITILFTALAQTINGALQGIGKMAIPAISLGCGVIVKLILNIILIRIPEIGVNGAAIGSVVCHIISFTIGFFILKKYVKIDFKFIKCIFKPIMATLMMAVVSYFIYINLNSIISNRIATLISIIIAVIIYAVLVILLKIFTKEEILMLPYGEKICNFLTITGIYK